MSARRLKVIVIGGGIGGLALGQALAGTGVDIEIHERNQHAGDWIEGHRLSINQVGSSALHQCLPAPLWQAFLAVAADPGFGLAFRTERLKELLVVEREVMTGGVTGPVGNQYAISRRVLRHVLTAGLRDTIRFGKEFTEYGLEADGSVTAYFADGTTATGDVLVGADGANSRVRGQYLPEARRIEHNAVSIAGRLPLTASTKAWLPGAFSGGMNSILPSGGRFFFTSAFAGRRQLTAALDSGLDLPALGLDPEVLLDDLQDYLLWAFITDHRKYPADAMALPRDVLKKLAGDFLLGWHPTLQRIVEETPGESVNIMRFKQSTTDVTWQSTQVTVLGDAIHNMPPVMGLGANVALRDAAELSQRLIAVQRGDQELVAAISEYESQMREYGLGAVRTAVKTTERAISANPVSRQTMKAWLRLCAAVPKVKQKSFGSVWTQESLAPTEH